MHLSKSVLRTLVLITIPLVGLSLIFTNQIEPRPSEQGTILLDLDDSTQADVFPAVLVKDDKGKSSPIHMSDLNIDVKVVGNIARTTMEMTFYNDSNRLLEGELYFPLGEGQTVSRFAMDVDGKLREGVVVEKEKGQQVFESVVRQNIDPGLLEWTKGNNFKARVYPIPAKGHKKILVAYEQELNMMNQSYLYVLPLNFKEKVENFDLKIEVVQQEVKPLLDENALVNLKFEKWEENYVAQVSKKDFLPGSHIGIALPLPKNKLEIYTERVPGTDDQYYYYTALTPRIGKAEVKDPNTIGLIWDASNSSSQRNIERELSVLELYFTEHKNITVKLISLRNEAQLVKSYTVANGNWSELRERLKEIPFDGASAYHSIDYTKYPCDAFLLFGDGLSNFGSRDGKLPKVPVYTLNSSSSANHSYLKYLSSATGGEYVNLLKTENSNALNLLKGGNFQYLGNGMSDSYPSIPTTVQEQIHVVGIIKGTTELDFAFGSGEAADQIHMTINPADHLTNTGLLRRIWAQKKLAELDINFEENSEAITSLGKEYSLVTRNTSLIVLDRVEDYVQHQIIPPAELQKDYFAQLNEQQKTTAKEKKDHMTQVKEDFKLYVDWWNTEYDLVKILEEDRVNKAKNSLGSTNDSIVNLYDENLSYAPLEEISVSNATFSSQHSDQLLEAQPERSKKDQKEKKSEASIQLEKWEPDAPYMKALKATDENQLYTTYLKLKKKNASTPSFFLDVSDFFIDKGQKEIALRILSNIAELELENHELMRVLAHRLEQLGYYDLAIMIYEEVADIRKEEPQSFRDLGLCLAKAKKYQEAVDMLYTVVETKWDDRFPGIESIALVEINQLIMLHKSKINADKIDPELIKEMPLDVRVILNWDSDNCDMDMWVTDPRGEKCFYSNKNTKIGGRISNDFTRGYGPEMFTIKKAMKGKYVVQVDYYGTTSQRVSGPTTIQLQLVTNYGKPNEKVEEITRRLSSTKEVLDIGSLLFE